MYTIIFSRARSDDECNSLLSVEVKNTEKEVHDYIRYRTFEQERLESIAYKVRGDRYYYGDYGFLVLYNGETVYESSNFSSVFEELDIPVHSDNYLVDCYEDLSIGVNQNNNLNVLIHMLERDERDYNEALADYRGEMRKQAEIAKEKELLKSLLEKYPDMKL